MSHTLIAVLATILLVGEWWIARIWGSARGMLTVRNAQSAKAHEVLNIIWKAEHTGIITPEQATGLREHDEELFRIFCIPIIGNQATAIPLPAREETPSA